MKTGSCVAISAITILTACAMSTGVMQMGPDTYSVSAGASPARGGEIGAKQMAMTEAGKHCRGMGREILVTNTSTKQTTVYGAGQVEITFQCLARGDPDLTRPSYTAPPTTVIQDQRQK